jgi:hypothetical protein
MAKQGKNFLVAGSGRLIFGGTRFTPGLAAAR